MSNQSTSPSTPGSSFSTEDIAALPPLRGPPIDAYFSVTFSTDLRSCVSAY